jgi:hypothetical protein
MTGQTLHAIAYDVHPGVALVQRWVRELPERTGKSLEDWAEIVHQLPASADHRQILKSQYGFGTNAAAWIVEHAEGRPTWDADPETYLRCAEQYVEGMFSGPRAALLPVYLRIVEVVRELGDDVRICPCKTIIPFYRHRVFGQVKASTQTRLDLFLALNPDQKTAGRLHRHERNIANGDRLTHYLSLSRLADLQSETRHWLEQAYERDSAAET